mmetsp:Transcript_54567/g.59209  ORF Transcript_54567/g.59209 Transcript_54567/m.59209 type:complete len:444 (-) Transcript_54567:2421-3752(-)
MENNNNNNSINNNDNGTHNHHRPRRPSSDTIAYLRGLPLDSEVAHAEVTRFFTASSLSNQEEERDDHDDEDSNDMEFPQSVAAALSALGEITQEIASLAGDEQGSQSLEVITRIVAPYSELASRILLHSCQGYYFHLATHRYGSHVLQTILQLSNVNTNTHALDLALHEEAPPSLREENDSNSLPSLYDLLVGVVNELTPHLSELATHLCGSHVVRTLLCVLGGVSLEASAFDKYKNTSIRGKTKHKKKKKKKKPSSSDDTDSSPSNAGSMSIVYIENPIITPSRFVSTLEAFSQALLVGNNDNSDNNNNEPGELQQQACHASAGPLLIVLIRVLTYSAETNASESESAAAQKEDSIWKQKQKDSSKSKSSKSILDDHRDTDTTTTTFGGALIPNPTNQPIADFRLGILKSEPRYATGSLADRAVKRILCWQDNDSGNDGKGR